LLVLDNCEHLIEACAELADDLLHACPGLKILASSREALGVAGETAYRVPSLTLPDPRPAAATPAMLARCEAARLFVERAHAAQPRFALTDSNAPAVAALCRRLDGIPLALELAAARVRVLPVEQILARLDDRFRLLVGGSRTALPRQQTLRALIDWSYDLLPEDERRLLRQLSVFVGGATLEAVEEVGRWDGGRRTDEELVRPSSSVVRPDSDIDVLDLLTQLINKSLVVVDDDGPTARYRLLETIRQYAREKLLDAGQQPVPGGEALTARNRHLAYFLQMTEAAEPRMKGADMIAALDELEAEQDNLRAALEWALDPKDGNHLAALRLVSVLGWFWARRTSLTEGRRWVQAALAAADADADTAAGPEFRAARARALGSAAELILLLGDHPAALVAAKASMALARQAGDARTLASVLGLGAMAAGFLGDAATARAWAAEGQALSDRHGFLFEQQGLTNLSMLLAIMANEPISLERRQELVRAARTTRNPYTIAMSFRNVGHIARTAGDYEAAYDAFAESTVLFQQMRDREFYTASRAEMGHARRMLGRHAEATAIYAETLPVWQELGRPAAVARELECLAYIAVVDGPVERAAQLFGAAETLREQTGSSMMFKERDEYDAAMAQLRAQSEPPIIEAAWARGRALTMNKAVAYALEAKAPDRPGS
jgi:non-specific serine/threonine protein kinase